MCLAWRPANREVCEILGEGRPAKVLIDGPRGMGKSACLLQIFDLLNRSRSGGRGQRPKCDLIGGLSDAMETGSDGASGVRRLAGLIDDASSLLTVSKAHWRVLGELCRLPGRHQPMDRGLRPVRGSGGRRLCPDRSCDACHETNLTGEPSFL
jgi:hypothetical protein